MAAGKKHAAPRAKTSGDFARMSADLHVNFTALGAVVDQLKTKLQFLDDELEADEKSMKEYRDDLKRIELERALVKARLGKNEEWAAQFDRDIGPFASQYDGLAKDIGELYESAKTKHTAGLAVLMDEFDYHPAFRRGPGDFFAIPFRPK